MRKFVVDDEAPNTQTSMNSNFQTQNNIGRRPLTVELGAWVHFNIREVGVSSPSGEVQILFILGCLEDQNSLTAWKEQPASDPAARRAISR